MAEPAVADAALRQERDGCPHEPAAFDPAQRAEDLWRLFEMAHVRTQAQIVDYAERAAAKGAVARGRRIAALSLAVLGVLTPGLAALRDGLRDGWAISFGLLALAGGLALFDQLFGASQSWMRDRQVQARLETLAVSLRYAWAARLAKSGAAISDAATVKDLADLILTHAAAVEALTGGEAGAWVEHFRPRLAAFDPTLGSTDAAAQAPPPA